MTENCIWFHQTDGVRHRLIDFYHNSGEGLPHYVQVLREKQEQHAGESGRGSTDGDVRLVSHKPAS
jgi:hypothetical protein